MNKRISLYTFAVDVEHKIIFHIFVKSDFKITTSLEVLQMSLSNMRFLM